MRATIEDNRKAIEVCIKDVLRGDWFSYTPTNDIFIRGDEKDKQDLYLCVRVNDGFIRRFEGGAVVTILKNVRVIIE